MIMNIHFPFEAVWRSRFKLKQYLDASNVAPNTKGPLNDSIFYYYYLFIYLFIFIFVFIDWFIVLIIIFLFTNYYYSFTFHISSQMWITNIVWCPNTLHTIVRVAPKKKSNPVQGNPSSLSWICHSYHGMLWAEQLQSGLVVDCYCKLKC